MSNVTPTSPANPVERPDRDRVLALGVLLSALFMDIVDSTIVSIALPHIQRDLQASDPAAQWILAGYTVTFALGLISGGRLGDIHGRKRAFVLGTVLFTLASLVCGAATGPTTLVVARMVQGIGAAVMLPQVLSVVMAMFGPRERAGAFALYGLVLSLGNVSGPILGGLLVQADLFDLGWRAVFYVNVPIGVLAILGGLRYLPESTAERALRVDLTGVVLVGAGTFALLVPVVQGREAGWPGWLVGMLLASVPLLVVFAAQQRRRDRVDGSALLPPRLFASGSFVLGAITLLVMFSGLASIFLVLTYQLQFGLGWSPMRTALAGVGWPIGIALTSMVARRYATTRPAVLIRSGLFTMALCTAGLIGVLRTTGTSVELWQVAAPVFAVGLGMGLCVSTLTGVMLAEVATDDAGAASGVVNAVQQLGAGIGLAIVGVLYFAVADHARGPGRSAGESAVAAGSSALIYNAAAFVLATLLAWWLPRRSHTAANRNDEAVDDTPTAQTAPTPQE